jgi:hypothetical protein
MNDKIIDWNVGILSKEHKDLVLIILVEFDESIEDILVEDLAEELDLVTNILYDVLG